MAIIYEVRVYCEDCGEWKYTTQSEVDNTWIPDGCEDHTLRDFVVDHQEEV